MKRLLSILTLLALISTPSEAYQLRGEENDIAHGLLGYSLQIATYGFFKGLLTQNRPSTLESRIMLHVFSTVIVAVALTLKEVGDDSACRGSGNPSGCLDMGAIGYGLMGAAAAHATIFMWQF